MQTPWFFERLGIAPTEDVKTIKRAYAVALKRIDQVAEREAFERLRKAYELALGWIASDEEDDDVDIDEDDDNEPIDDPVEDDAVAPVLQGDVPPAPPPSPPGLALQPEPDPGLQPPVVLQAEHADPARSEQAIDEWVMRLLATRAAGVAAHGGTAGNSSEQLLAQALNDPRLSHLDSQSRLEARLADALHQDPEGRVDLFEAAARKFGWTGREERALGSFAAARWVSQVVDQGLQWESQKPSVRKLQQTALQAAAASGHPSDADVENFAAPLAHMQADFPEWLALRLRAARCEQWHQASIALAARAPRRAGWKKRYFGSLARGIATFAVLSFFLSFALQIATFAVRELSDRPPAAARPAGGQPTSKPAAAEPVLAYELTGAITAESCGTAHEFVHESNWLAVDDADAVALLATRAMRCQDKDLWPQKDDALMKCLRTERAAALSAGRVEQAANCAPEQKPKGKPP